MSALSDYVAEVKRQAGTLANAAALDEAEHKAAVDRWERTRERTGLAQLERQAASMLDSGDWVIVDDRWPPEDLNDDEPTTRRLDSGPSRPRHLEVALLQLEDLHIPTRAVITELDLLGRYDLLAELVVSCTKAVEGLVRLYSAKKRGDADRAQEAVREAVRTLELWVPIEGRQIIGKKRHAKKPGRPTSAINVAVEQFIRVCLLSSSPDGESDTLAAWNAAHPAQPRTRTQFNSVWRRVVKAVVYNHRD